MANQPLASALFEHLRYDLSHVQGYDPYETRSGASMGALAPDTGIKAAYAKSLQNSFLKKFQDEIETGDVDEVGINKFLDANAKCARWQYAPESTWDEILLGTFRRHLCAFFEASYPPPPGEYVSCSDEKDPMPLFDWSGSLDWARVSYFADNGPGSSLGAVGTSWFEKFTRSPLTYSREFLLELYWSRCKRADSHSQVEAERFANHGCQLRES